MSKNVLGSLGSLKKFAEENRVPIVKEETALFLEEIIRQKRPEKILEVGSAIGYSSLRIMGAAPRGARFIGIEKDADLALEARTNIEAYGYSNRMRIIYGDALEVIGDLSDSYDFCFLDAAKGQYPRYFKLLDDRLEKGGILIADNIHFRGLVEEEGIKNRRKITIIKRLRTFQEMILENENYKSKIFNIGDGISVSIKEG